METGSKPDLSHPRLYNSDNRFTLAEFLLQRCNPGPAFRWLCKSVWFFYRCYFFGSHRNWLLSHLRFAGLVPFWLSTGRLFRFVAKTLFPLPHHCEWRPVYFLWQLLNL